MTVPEEKRPKTDETDPAPRRVRAAAQGRSEPDTRPAVGAELQDKMAEKNLSTDDLTGS
ncbi:hypothetical protein [Actinomadura atramentaria]|uniref:hypothetical protein n=1 Tax=Actinomadura atramentaria TaxID=1990 RepID=UPI000380A37C|nr:hypothetical protein [Actinomadura atramentaria]